ncbi:MAG: hypothetical protein AAFV53_28245 [Myxococcota bacterium]
MLIVITLIACNPKTSPEPSTSAEPTITEPTITEPTVIEPTVEEPVACEDGQSCTVGGVAVHITSIEDSRCPKDVTCMWAGLATVQLSIGDAAHTLELNPAETALPEVAVGENTLQLVRVEPYPEANTSKPPTRTAWLQLR